MKIKYSILALVCLFYACQHATKQKNIADYHVIPIPQSINLVNQLEDKDFSFILNKRTSINYHDESLKYAADNLASFLSKYSGYKLEVKHSQESSNSINLSADYNHDNLEAYKLEVNTSNISIAGASKSGVFYGVQTLMKSLNPKENTEIIFPNVLIEDYPIFLHRGAMLDVSRHFSDKEFVKKFIDMLAFNNMNVFHWHLTDDQGWRIEIKEYPKLTEIGSRRDSTATGRHTNAYHKVLHEGFYTQADIKEVVDYAQMHNITIIPEIDLPGHMLAALTAYPHLGCTGGPYTVGPDWGIYEDVLCAGNEEVFDFLNAVFSEVIELFPSKYIHIGGDECLKNSWLACPKCQAKMKELNVKANTTDGAGEQLQSWFIARIEKMLNEKGKQIIGWEEILEGGIAPNATIMSWRGVEGAVYAAERGHDVIMAPESHVYLDYYQSDRVVNEPFTFGWHTPLKKTYSFNPIPSQLPEDVRKHILGAQVNLWTEYMPTSKIREYMLLPRLTAIAETLWSYPEHKDYNAYLARLHKFARHFDALAYENHKEVYGIQDSLVVNTEKKQLELYLSTFDDAPIELTWATDTEQTNKTIKNGEPIIINEPTTITAQMSRPEKKYSYKKDFKFNLATASILELNSKPDGRYAFDKSVLIDGQDGVRKSYRTGSWLGFLGKDFEASLDLRKECKFNYLRFNVYHNTRGDMFPPKSISVFTSNDGINYKKIHAQSYDEVLKHSQPHINNFVLAIEGQARYIRLEIETIKVLPSWHEKAGQKAYLFIDEIEIN